jgi:hypothetical protein
MTYGSLCEGCGGLNLGENCHQFSRFYSIDRAITQLAYICYPICNYVELFTLDKVDDCAAMLLLI